MSVNIYFCPQNKMSTNFCSTKRSFERRHKFSVTLISYLHLIAPKARRLRLTISISMPWHLWTGIMICILPVCEIGISCQFTFTYFLLVKIHPHRHEFWYLLGCFIFWWPPWNIDISRVYLRSWIRVLVITLHSSTSLPYFTFCF